MSVLTNAGALGALLGMVIYTGFDATPPAAAMDPGRQDYKDEIRKRFRRPVNELINEVGEGRGWNCAL